MPVKQSKVRTPTYRSWEAMKRRCNTFNPLSADFHVYAARGIYYIPRWEHFSNFLEDMGCRPEGRSLDRIDNDKGYSKENCRWATASQQNSNRRPLWMTDKLGEQKCRGTV